MLLGRARAARFSEGFEETAVSLGSVARLRKSGSGGSELRIARFSKEFEKKKTFSLGCLGRLLALEASSLKYVPAAQNPSKSI